MVESAKAAAGDRDILAVGISTPGPTKTFEGIVTTPPNLPGWHDVPLAKLISERMGLPAWIENDVNAGALAEHRAGAGRGKQHVVMIAPGTGIGGGLVLDGKLYRGASGGAGEIGHMQLDPRGPRCQLRPQRLPGDARLRQGAGRVRTGDRAPASRTAWSPRSRPGTRSPTRILDMAASRAMSLP